MAFLHTLLKQRSIIPVTLAVVISVFFITALLQAATTISTDISTDGTLSVTDTSTLTGAVTLSSTLTVTGDVIVDTNDFIIDVSANAVSIGTTTPSDDKTFQVDGGTATGTIAADSSLNELFGGCIEVKSMIASSTFHIVATTTGPVLFQTGSCIGGSISQ